MHTKTLGKNLRNEFPIFAHNERLHNGTLMPLHYLDSAATAQKPSAVIDALKNFLECNYGTVHRGAYSLSAKSSLLYEDARAEVARFLGPSFKPHQIIFTKGTTESLNILASGFAETILNENSRIVIPITEHHANLVPWQQAALKADCELAYIRLNNNEDNKFTLNIEQAKKLITPSTKVVSVAHMGNVLGQINPIKELIVLAKNVNAYVVIDCAQSVTCLNQDLFTLGADAIAFSGHKVYGPTGIGVLALKDELASILPPFVFGGSMVTSVTEEGAQWAASPAKFEGGTPPIAEAIGLMAALKWYQGIGGHQKVHKHCANLASAFIEGLKKIPKIQIFSPQSGQETIVSFHHETIHSHDLVTILDAHNIAMRAGHHCAWPLVHQLKVDSLCRASFACYNDFDDIEASLEILKNHRFFAN